MIKTLYVKYNKKQKHSFNESLFIINSNSLQVKLRLYLKNIIFKLTVFVISGLPSIIKK